jgi:hypothetical protein
MTLGKSASKRSLPINATTTIVNATSEAATPPAKRDSQQEPLLQSKDGKDKKQTSSKDDARPEKPDIGVNQNGVAAVPESTSATPKPGPIASTTAEPQSIWLSWLPGKADTASTKAPKTAESTPAKPSEAQNAEPQVETSLEPNTVHSKSNEQSFEAIVAANNKRSWYQMWSSGQATADQATQAKSGATAVPSQTGTADGEAKAPTTATTLDVPQPSTPKVKDSSQASSLETSPPPPLSGDGSKSAWVFWSREKKRAGSIRSESEPHVGEIAISDTPSQARPKRASISLQDDSAKPVLKPSPQEVQSKKTDAQRTVGPKVPTSTEQNLTLASPKKQSTKDSARTSKATSSNAAATAKDPRPASPAPTIDKKKENTNLLLPSLQETLTHEEQPSLIQQLARLLYYTREPSAHQHLSLSRDPPRIKRALAVGVHGFFPGPMVRSIIGQPTGTSIKFAEKAAQNIRRYVSKQGYDCEVKTAALEGEGRIAERVELLWKLLLNWIDEIRRSDFILIAAHSQGVPVALMLVAKLIHFGCLAPSARIGICGMAGVNMGPFQDYKSPWITGTAGELFEFSDPNSKVSKDYLAAISECLKHGVKVTFVGSIDDQLVSMESSIFAPLSHPHIYRAVSIDSRIHAPNFLSNLVGFVLKLRNVGVPDHGLIRELSTPLAGSLYTGEGHSRLYEDDAVYALAISFTLETTSLPNLDITSSKRAPLSAGGDGKSGSSSSGSASVSGSTSLPANPYILPFAMRGILEEDIVKKELRDEAKKLLEQFDEWEPKTKVLKDVKFRLEGVRSQLL